MAGRAITRARREAGVITPGEAYNNARVLLAGWLPECLESIMTLARGVHIEKTVIVDGLPKQKVYRQPPNFLALVYLTDRAMGKTRVEASEVDDAYTIARTKFIETQLGINWLQAQAADMEARARRAAIECDLYPKQFVTEEEQEARLRDIARAANKALIALTPEAFAALCPGVEDPAAALENLRERLGRDQAVIFEEVMTGGREVADEEDEDAE